MGFGDRLKHAWNAFRQRDETHKNINYGRSYGYKSDKWFFSRSNERTIVGAIYNRIAIDASSISIRHVINDESSIFKEYVNDGLDYCLNTEANIDQTGREFIQNIVLNLLDDGYVAIVPIDTTLDPTNSDSYDIQTMRVGQILNWYPEYVRVRVYNIKTGMKEEITLPKKMVGIVENPFYSVMNDKNSVIQRLVTKMNILDGIDKNANSQKLNLIMQLPYVIKSKARQEQAELRRKQIEEQLTNNKYGVAYIDGTEKITQLGRSIDNNYNAEIQYLTTMLYGQLGLSEAVMNGTASEQEQLNYWNRTIEPILSAITNEMRRKFITKAARSRGHDLLFTRDPFKLMPISNVGDIADKLTRNEIMTSNEIRAKIGMKPSSDPNADILRNKNMPVTETDNPNNEVYDQQYDINTDNYINYKTSGKNIISQYASRSISDMTNNV